jgi:hypothetical protein
MAPPWSTTVGKCSLCRKQGSAGSVKLMKRFILVCVLVASGCDGQVKRLELAVPDASILVQSEDGGRPSGLFDAGSIEVPDASVLDAGVDAGTADADAGPLLVSVFVAVGKQGRHAISCDDGLSWQYDVSIDDSWVPGDRYQCFSGNFIGTDGGAVSTDCDHNANSILSVVTENGRFVYSMGWGAPGSFWRSTNGVDFVRVDTGTNAADMMYGAGRFVAANRVPKISDDDGLTWLPGTEANVSNGNNVIYNVRGGVFGGPGNGSFVMTANDGTNFDVAYSLDKGQTWRRPTLKDGSRMDICGTGKVTYGKGIFVMSQWSNVTNLTTICHSLDLGVTWTAATSAENFESKIIFDGREFVAFSNGKIHRSMNALNWNSTPIQTRRAGVLSAGPNIGAVAVSPSGTFSAVNGGWQTWYEKQHFFRSTDGIIWDELALDKFKQGHPITGMVWAQTRPSAVCK